jgi:heme-degrading monooxygenase HmoA
MVIGEAISDEQVREFARIYAAEVLPVLKTEPGFHLSRFMTEDGGNMAVSLTVWKSRDDCLRYHSSGSYRQFVARTQHLLLGNFVVKLFKDHGGL